MHRLNEIIANIIGGDNLKRKDFLGDDHAAWRIVDFVERERDYYFKEVGLRAITAWKSGSARLLAVVDSGSFGLSVSMAFLMTEFALGEDHHKCPENKISIRDTSDCPYLEHCEGDDCLFVPNSEED